MATEIKPADLSKYTGTTFTVLNHPTGRVELTLTDDVQHQTTTRNETYSFVFNGPGTAFLPQSIYQIQHPTLGTFDLFLVPIARDAHGFQYQVIFNQFLSTTP